MHSPSARLALANPEILAYEQSIVTAQLFGPAVPVALEIGRSMRLLIADDHDLVRDGLREIVRRDDPDSEIFTATNLRDAIAAVERHPDVDVALLDLYMPGMHGIDGAMQLSAQFPELKVVLMSGMASNADIMRSIRAGIHGFIPKTISGSSLLAALRLVKSGERYFPANLYVSASSPAGSTFTERDRQIFGQLRLGRTNKEIAHHLGLEEVLVKSALRSLGAKLGARTRTEIALKGLEALAADDSSG